MSSTMVPARYRSDDFVKGLALRSDSAVTRADNATNRATKSKKELVALKSGRGKLIRGAIVGTPIAGALGAMDGFVDDDSPIPPSAPIAILGTLIAIGTNNGVIGEMAAAANVAAAHEAGRRAGKGLRVKLSSS